MVSHKGAKYIYIVMVNYNNQTRDVLDLKEHGLWVAHEIVLKSPYT